MQKMIVKMHLMKGPSAAIIVLRSLKRKDFAALTRWVLIDASQSGKNAMEILIALTLATKTKTAATTVKGELSAQVVTPVSNQHFSAMVSSNAETGLTSLQKTAKTAPNQTIYSSASQLG